MILNIVLVLFVELIMINFVVLKFRKCLKKINMEQLVQNVLGWAEDKGILSKDKSLAQMCKVIEEVGETASALVKKDTYALRDGIGDSMVTLIVLAGQNGFTPQECLQAAWDEIKDRKGKVNENGAFVKESDLDVKYSVKEVLSELPEDIKGKVLEHLSVNNSVHHVDMNNKYLFKKNLSGIFVFPDNEFEYWLEVERKYFRGGQ
jgi:phosphoribosyl-ATP pyrophosphohydrolase